MLGARELFIRVGDHREKDNGDANEGKVGLEPNRYLLLRAEDNRGRTMGQGRIGNGKGQKGHAYVGSNNRKWEREERSCMHRGKQYQTLPGNFPLGKFNDGFERYIQQ